MASTTGTLFRVTTWGESHGPAIGVIVDGCPPGLALSTSDIQPDLDRRRPGQSALTTQRKEADTVRILSGVHEGHTTGTPIAIQIDNQDARPKDYDALTQVYRPSHADYTYDAKYGRRDPRGGGRASARETAARCAAAAIARKLLEVRWGIEVVAWVSAVADLVADPVDVETLTRTDVDASPSRCPQPDAAAAMVKAIEAARKNRDTLGGVIGCVARNVPAGWGEPIFDRLEADLAKACLSLPAAKAFESGSGFAGTRMRGSEHNDIFETSPAGTIQTRTNYSGGIQGGISNGMPIRIRVGFKPVATLPMDQPTINQRGEEATVRGKGRHDPCVVPRAVPIVEAAVLLVLADHGLRQQALLGGSPQQR